MRAIRAVATFVVLATACDDDACLALPCAPPTAIRLTVTAAGGTSGVPGVFVTVSGAAAGQGACDASTTCLIAGAAGTYQLDIGAPGYVTVHRTLVVAGHGNPCGCDTVDTQDVVVVLARAS